ncbi:MarR family transcriptional regulator [Roseomonas sp. OT10]|uniref:MarR family winged helix-turn-helix transcriptional regulator n=1 Tax=Roseomonas cutis TaxID=2897332 RepID=UPI001E56B125|nr:MarR family transcriptional regulator [Roseomonas sp. OT10]UFN47148.1 MarR family transcriptional regulator [Roseomonas sp. OT10]
MAARPKALPRAARAAAPAPDAGGPTEAAEVDLSPLDTHLGFLMRIAQQRIFDEFHQRFSPHGLTPARYAVLALLSANPGARQVALANALQIKQSNFAVLIAAMEADGLVQRHADARNRRANMLRLSPAGAAAFATLSRAVLAMEAEFAQRLTVRQHEAILAGLRRFLAS